MWNDSTRHVRLIRNFPIGTSLSNRIRIETSDSNSNRISKPRRSLRRKPITYLIDGVNWTAISTQGSHYGQHVFPTGFVQCRLTNLHNVLLRQRWYGHTSEYSQISQSGVVRPASRLTYSIKLLLPGATSGFRISLHPPLESRNICFHPRGISSGIRAVSLIPALVRPASTTFTEASVTHRGPKQIRRVGGPIRHASLLQPLTYVTSLIFTEETRLFRTTNTEIIELGGCQEMIHCELSV